MHPFIVFLGFLLLSSTSATTPFKPKALVLPITKDASTKQYVITINQRTPRVAVKTSLDLGGHYLWVDCDDGKYVSSTYNPVRCRTAACKLAGSYACGVTCNSPPRPGCNNNTCGVTIDNPLPLVRTSTNGDLGQDIVSIRSTNGYYPGKEVFASNVLFGCGSSPVMKGLPQGAQGFAGFGRSLASFPFQLSSAVKVAKKFAICLSSFREGAIFVGGGPYVPIQRWDISTHLSYTPLILNPVSTAGSYFVGESSTDYFINLTSILVNGDPLKLNTSLLTIDKNGVGGTKLSSVVPYTVLQTSILRALIIPYSKVLTQVPAVKPFEFCFKSVGSNRVGPTVPPIDFVLHNNDTVWRMWGANSMVEVAPGILCLAFVDGGLNPQTAVVIGGYQMENNLLEFDLPAARLGFSSSLLFTQTTCANFNFTASE